jgi:hypothetical protein
VNIALGAESGVDFMAHFRQFRGDFGDQRGGLGVDSIRRSLVVNAG